MVHISMYQTASKHEMWFHTLVKEWRDLCLNDEVERNHATKLRLASDLEFPILSEHKFGIKFDQLM